MASPKEPAQKPYVVTLMLVVPARNFEEAKDVVVAALEPSVQRQTIERGRFIDIAAIATHPRTQS